MIKKLENLLFSTVVLGSFAVSALLATPAAASAPKLSVATTDRIRVLCEASSMDLAGKRSERRCRAEWQERLERLGLQHGRPVRLDLR